MKIAIVGGGFSGLSAALELSKSHHKVTLFEKENRLGGLAGTFKRPNWQWHVEQHYHHFFSNDFVAINLIKKLGLSQKLFFPQTLTSLYYQGKIYPFNTPAHVLAFSPLSFVSRLRLGLVSLLCKCLPLALALNFEKMTAYDGIRKFYGEKILKTVWEPLLIGKFGKLAGDVNMAWFWARIKKRTLTLGYLEGGYQTLLEALGERIKKNGGKIFLSSPFDPAQIHKYDKVIITTPAEIFLKMFPKMPVAYKKRLTKTPHLHALNLLLITKEKFLQDTYWLNINDRDFPFIAVIQHTNMIDRRYYGGNHLTYVANYLPCDHPYLKMSAEQLLELYLPYLQKINPSFNWKLEIGNWKLFIGPFAQPVFPINYAKVKPDFKTPIKNVYLANMDMVYPWDRGTNYAIELGEKVAELVGNC